MNAVHSLYRFGLKNRVSTRFCLHAALRSSLLSLPSVLLHSLNFVLLNPSTAFSCIATPVTYSALHSHKFLLPIPC
jgi:hypothetical protein